MCSAQWLDRSIRLQIGVKQTQNARAYKRNHEVEFFLGVNFPCLASRLSLKAL